MDFGYILARFQHLIGFEATHLRPRNRAENAQGSISGAGKPAAGF
jgi:hypothetical protein